MAYHNRAWVETVLTRTSDGALGVASSINRLQAGGMKVLEFRVIRTGDETFVLLMNVCEDDQTKGEAPEKRQRKAPRKEQP